MISIIDIKNNLGISEDNPFKAGKDFEKLYSVLEESSNTILLDDICFDAKFAHGVIKIVQRRDESLTEDAILKMQTEYTEAVKRLHANLAKIVQELPDFFRDIFNKKYLELSQEGMSNLSKLIEDFAAIKMLLNKEKKKG